MACDSASSRSGQVAPFGPGLEVHTIVQSSMTLIRLFLAVCLSAAISHPQLTAQQFAFNADDLNAAISVQPGERELTAVCFLGTQCPMARAYASHLNAMQDEFQSQGLQIVGVFSNVQDSTEDLEKFVAELEVKFPVVHDQGNRVADLYRATRTPEVYLLDRDLQLRYHGRIDDRYAPGVARSSATREDLRLAIEQSLADEPVAVPETTALGCIIGRVPSQSLANRGPAEADLDADATATGEAAESMVTYSKDVTRMLQRNCIECHRAGEIGPFAMDSYEEVVGWAETMLETIDNQRMPPWHAAPEYGEFANSRFMSESDKQLFRDWIAGGFARGDESDLPPPADYVEGWRLEREPDMVVEMRDRPFIVPKEGVVEYQYFVADLGLTEDKWVAAAQVIPGNASVVHHAIAFVRPPDGSRFRGVGWLSAYVPGQRTQTMPPGRARLLPAGSKLVFQMHYTPNGKEQADITKIGLIFMPESEVTHEVFTLVGIDQEFEIPPNASGHVVEAEVPWLPEDGELLAVTPHMHYRGKSFRLFGGSAQQSVLLDVPNYDFNWQHTYQFSVPLRLNRLERLAFAATFDNSATNPFNPNPNEWVAWGDQTWEEMAVAFFEVAEPRVRDSSSGERRSAGGSRDPRSSQEIQVSTDKEAKIEAYVNRMFSELDSDGDGKIHRSETGILLRRWDRFELWDRNGDGVLTRDELREVARGLYR
jgi:peroxiredoxin